ncbi:Opi1-domain-containing protein [Microstroma glucosiphilum]|uniref:Opi1-domain-containing protein n=1 Tax=Pseudomicrostroma glucosiphilum TaxID=1684307 RepID=A0A316UGC2_9BASI|nr:Opi1-domain-containing protein [Pseudomicrostroma glucosiphilum]PWN22963.1 Opi1-domain-containing protein [Pseudomicrostroma glucosiphilum]
MEESEASGSRASPYSRAMLREQSEDTRWRKTREPSGSITDAPTPAASAVEGSDYLSGSTPSTPGVSGWNTSNARATVEGGPSSSSTLSSATPARTTNRSAEEEDEDVHIAVMALGAMRNLDGRRMQSGLEKVPGPVNPTGVVGRQRDGSNASMSASSITSTAISSPSSTPATELTQASASTSGGSVQSARVSGGDGNYTFSGGDGRRHSRSFSGAATLADLPSDFEFPALVRDENGNEVEVDREMLGDADFLKRVSHLPLVRGTLRAYELGKQKSKIVKYGGDLVESSVKAISRPVVGRLGASLGENRVEQLDDFACRQLDRFYPGSSASMSKEERQKLMADLDERERTEWAHMGEEERVKRRRAYCALHLEEKERETVVNELRQRKGKGKSPPQASATAKDSSAEARDKQVSRSSGSSASPSSTSTARMRNAGLGSEALSQTQMQNALIESVKAGNGASSSRWGSMLVEAGATAGGLSAAMSEESMKSLKYCLQWLQYATAHIEHQITVLRDLIVKLNHGELELTSPAAQNLTQIKGDVVTTIRSVVDVVGKYAGGALPEPARVSVKAFILSLPARWASVNRAPAVTNASSFGGSPASPSFSPAHFSSSGDASSPGGRARSSSSASNTSLAHRNGGAAQPMSAAATAQAANRVLTLAVESLDILRSVTVVVGESLDRAELWMERLRMLGLQRKRQHEQDTIGNGHNAIAFSGSGSGPLGGPASWESARGMAARGRADSLGGESDLSMGTSASTKRRRIKAGSSAMVAGGGGSGSGSGSASASATGTGGAVGSPIDPTFATPSAPAASSGHAGFSAGSGKNGTSQVAGTASSSYDQSPGHASARRRKAVVGAGQRAGE